MKFKLEGQKIIILWKFYKVKTKKINTSLRINKILGYHNRSQNGGK